MSAGEFKFLHNENLKTQMLMLKYGFTSMGVLKIEPPAKGHDDYCDAMAILCKYPFYSGVQEEFMISSG